MIKKYLSLLCLLSFLSGCSKPKSMFAHLGPEEDGIVAIEIPDDAAKEPLGRESLRGENELSDIEKDIIDLWHEGEHDKISFVVINPLAKKYLRSYFSDTPQRLASVSKLSTALGALENVNNVSVSKVQKMLKTSDNGEASRYVRLAAKAIGNVLLSTKPYTEASSCPDEYLNEAPVAGEVFNWLQTQISNVDWQGASLFDGAGCNYDNFMSAHQVTKILEFADSKGKVFGGMNFEDLLSVNGVDGTWKNKNLDNKGYIFAKTGTLLPNGNLVGYFYAKRNNIFHKYYFVIFVQKKGGGEYSTKARNLMEDLMRYWIDYYSSNEGIPIKDF